MVDTFSPSNSYGIISIYTDFAWYIYTDIRTLSAIIGKNDFNSPQTQDMLLVCLVTVSVRLTETLH